MARLSRLVDCDGIDCSSQAAELSPAPAREEQGLILYHGFAPPPDDLEVAIVLWEQGGDPQRFDFAVWKPPRRLVAQAYSARGLDDILRVAAGELGKLGYRGIKVSRGHSRRGT